MSDIWLQHEARIRVCGFELRYLRYLDKQYLDHVAGLTNVERTEAARLLNRYERGAQLTEDELTAIQSLVAKRDKYGEYGACFIPKKNAGEVRDILKNLPHDEAENLIRVLDILTDGVPQDVHDIEIMTPILTVLKIPITTLDNLTLQQGIVVLNILQSALENGK